MWLPWQRLVVPTLYHLYAHLHINIIHPCKFEEISLKSKWGVIRTRIFFYVVTMATPCRTQVISPVCTSTHQYHPSMQVWRNFIKQWMRSYPQKTWLTDGRTDGRHTIIRPFGRIKMGDRINCICMQIYFKTWKYVPISEVFIYSFMWAYMYTWFFFCRYIWGVCPPPIPKRWLRYCECMCVYTKVILEVRDIHRQ